jgi:hypothetical protein
MIILVRWSIAILLLGTAALPCSRSAKAQECTHGCLIELEGLQRTYSPGSHTKLSIHNKSTRDLDVNVAIEGLLEAGSWMEIAGSISDPSHSFSKMVKLRPVKAGTSLVLAFNPCKTPILIKTGDPRGKADPLGKTDRPCSKPVAGAGMPISLRLRVDVFDRGRDEIVQRVRSEEFRLVSGNEFH